MNEQSRFFDFLYFQQKHFPQSDMLSAKENGRWTSYSTQTVIDSVNQLSAGLLKLGLSGNNMNVEQQDKIAIISKNRPEWLMLDLACQQIGVLLCPIYPTTGVRELEFIFNDAEIKYVFISGNEILERVNSIKDKTPALINIFSFDENLECIFWKNLLQEISSENIAKAEKLRNSIQPHHCATIIYTSGTTGYPKGVMLSHSNLVTNVINAVATFPFSPMPKAKALSFLPLNHIFERIASYIYMYNGISIYYAESMESIGENLKEIKPVIFTTVPRLLEKVFEKIMDKGAELKGIKRKLFFWAVSLGERYDNLVDNGIWYEWQRFIANKIIFSKWREALGEM
jgi:long-chain acyl-CoA synthetase